MSTMFSGLCASAAIAQKSLAPLWANVEANVSAYSFVVVRHELPPAQWQEGDFAPVAEGEEPNLGLIVSRPFAYIKAACVESFDVILVGAGFSKGIVGGKGICSESGHRTIFAYRANIDSLLSPNPDGEIIAYQGVLPVLGNVTNSRRTAPALALVAMSDSEAKACALDFAEGRISLAEYQAKILIGSEAKSSPLSIRAAEAKPVLLSASEARARAKAKAEAEAEASAAPASPAAPAKAK